LIDNKKVNDSARERDAASKIAFSSQQILVYCISCEWFYDIFDEGILLYMISYGEGI
jgi:hypothetical protein